MTSSSPEAAAVGGAGVLTADVADRVAVRPLPIAEHELRSGGLTRLGSDAVRGDAVTEHTLAGLVAETRAAARAQGYSTGWAEGRRAALESARELEQQLLADHRREETRREAEHRTAVQALLQAAARIDEATASVCAEVEQRAAEVALALTEELVGHELAVATAPGADAVRRALRLCTGDPVVRIRVSPDQADDPELVTLAGAAAVVTDPALGRGDALVETVDCVVDARISAALARVREVLLP